MDHYKLLEHTADIGIVLQAESPEGLFRAAATGLTELLGVAKGTASASHRIELKAGDREELIVCWFNEMLFLLETESFLTHDARIIEYDSRRIYAELRGERTGNNAVLREIKSATYHQLSFKQEEKGWQARLYLDL